MRANYDELGQTIAALTEGETDAVSLMATVSELHAVNYKYLGNVHVVLPLTSCLRNGYATPLGYAEF